MAGQSNCDSCVNHVYYDRWDCYFCVETLDEDELIKYLTRSFYNCHYYRLYDEYQIVKKQMRKYFQQM